METLTKNDGIISLMHCQEWNFVQDTFRLEFENSCCHCPPQFIIFKPISDTLCHITYVKNLPKVEMSIA